MKVVAYRGSITPRKKLVSLNNVAKTRDGLRKFKSQILSNLGDAIFDFRTEESLVFNVLKEISPINKKLSQDQASIDRECGKIIRYFGFNKEVSINLLTDQGPVSVRKEKESNKEIFCKYVLQIDKIPYHIYKELSYEITDDLLKISELLKWYESNPCVQRYIEHNETPHTHEDKVIYDFYKRCVKERIEILNYQLYGIRNVPLLKQVMLAAFLPALNGSIHFFMTGRTILLTHFQFIILIVEKLIWLDTELGIIQLETLEKWRNCIIKIRKSFIKNILESYRLSNISKIFFSTCLIFP